MFNMVAHAHMYTVQCNAAARAAFFVLFVAACPMLIARAHTYPVQCSSQRVGALLIQRPAWVDQPHRWVPVEHPQYTGARKGWL